MRYKQLMTGISHSAGAGSLPEYLVAMVRRLPPHPASAHRRGSAALRQNGYSVSPRVATRWAVRCGLVMVQLRLCCRYSWWSQRRLAARGLDGVFASAAAICCRNLHTASSIAAEAALGLP